MAIKDQARLLKAVGDILLGDPKKSLTGAGTLKTEFPQKYTMEKLPRSTPEEEGVSSEWLNTFLIELSAAKHGNIHDFIAMRHGKVICESSFSPYRKDIWHVTHSLCKTFTGTAVGIAIGENLFGLNDPIINYFEDKIGRFNAKAWQKVTVRHLLTMSSGIIFNEINQAFETDWLKSIFSADPAFPAGTQFVYNSINSYVLSALVCRTSGQSLTNYLAKRLFTPLGFGPVFWEKSPDGYEKGGWGMYVMPEDMAKLGQLYLQKGKWIVNGAEKQIIPQTWVTQATKPQIKTDSDENYGYQIWTDEKLGGFLASGMFGQYIIVIPRLDFVFTMTSGNPNLFASSSTYTVIEKYFTNLQLPETLPPAPSTLSHLEKNISHLFFQKPILPKETIPHRIQPQNPRDKWQQNRTFSPIALPKESLAFCGTTWEFPENRGGLMPAIAQCMNYTLSSGVKAVRFEEMAGTLKLFWEEGNSTLSVPIGFTIPLENRVRLENEEFVISTFGQIAYDEDDVPILKLLVCPIELTSSRIMKFSLRDENLFLEMDEMPQFSVAIASALRQNSTTSNKNDTGSSTKSSNPLAKFGIMQDFATYKIDQICTPRITGTPLISKMATKVKTKSKSKNKDKK